MTSDNDGDSDDESLYQTISIVIIMLSIKRDNNM